MHRHADEIVIDLIMTEERKIMGMEARLLESYTSELGREKAVSYKESLPKFKEVRTVSWDEIRSLCMAKGWYTRGTCEQYSNLAGFVYDMEEATAEDLVYIASDILEHSDTKYDIEAILWELNRVCNTSFEHQEVEAALRKTKQTADMVGLKLAIERYGVPDVIYVDSGVETEQGARQGGAMKKTAMELVLEQVDKNKKAATS